MWRRLSRLFLCLGAGRASLEALLVYVVLLAALWTVHSELSQRVVLQGLFFVSLAGGGLCAVRLKLPSASRQLRAEARIGLALTAFLVVSAIEIDRITGSWPDQYPLPPVGQLILIALIGGTYVGPRCALYSVMFWNRLRRSRLLWSLTNAHIQVVLLFFALLIGRAVYSLVTSTRFFSLLAIEGNNLTLSEAARLAIGGLLLLSGLSVVALVIIALLVPPSAIFSFLVTRTTIGRIRTLAEATRAMRARNFAVRVKIEGEDEIAQLQADFNAMAGELDGAINDLQRERDTVSRLLDNRRTLAANVSHELRTPIATLRASLESALEHEAVLTPHDLDVMRRDVLHLQTLVDDLFMLSRAEVGQLTLRCTPTDLAPIVRQVADSTAPMAWRTHRVEVITDLPADLPSIRADGERVEQILRNLLHNSVRHTAPGGIVTLSALVAPDHVTLEVWDTGEGIASEDLPHVWERFYKVGRSDQTDSHRLGLGLALVKELTEAMGGSVGVESTPGTGSRFTVCLPQG